MLLIHAPWMVIVVWTVVIFKFDKSKGEQVSAPDQTGIACFKMSYSTWTEHR